MIINNLGKLLRQKKISIKQLSESTGFTTQNLDKIRRNKSKSYKNSTTSKICNALGVSVTDFFSFISNNLSFKIIKHYSKTVTDDNNGTYWIHLVLEAINPHYSKNSDDSFTPKSIGYFNFDTRITAERNLLKVGYQTSKSIPLYDLRKSGLRPLDRNYLLSVVSNKHNLVNCVLKAISLHNNTIIKTVFPGTILNGTITYYPNGKKKTYHYKNSVPAISAKIIILPVLETVMLNGKVAPINDSNGLIVKAQELPNIYGTVNFNKDNPRNNSINYSSNKHSWYYSPARTNDKRDKAIFALFNPHDPQHYGGNGINDTKDKPNHHEMFINAEVHKTSLAYEKISNKVKELKRLQKKIKAHNDKIRKSEHDKLDKAVKDFNKESSERAKKILAKNHLNHNK